MFRPELLGEAESRYEVREERLSLILVTINLRCQLNIQVKRFWWGVGNNHHKCFFFLNGDIIDIEHCVSLRGIVC